jgi:hypothetical protein
VYVQPILYTLMDRKRANYVRFEVSYRAGSCLAHNNERNQIGQADRDYGSRACVRSECGGYPMSDGW